MNCIAFLSYEDASCGNRLARASARIRALLGARGPNGKVAHAELRFGDGMIMLGTAGPNDFGLRTPRELGAVNQGVYVIVDDIAAALRACEGRGRGDPARAHRHGLRVTRVHRPGPRRQHLEPRDVST